MPSSEKPGAFDGILCPFQPVTDPMQEFHIETPEQLDQLCARLRGSPWFALDTEFVREKTYYPQFCLLQISNGELAASIDPLALEGLEPLLDILFDPTITKVFHAGRQDLEIFHLLWGRLPTPLFDTQLAATLLGLGDQISYGNLVKKVLEVELEKGQARTDWSRRPLRQVQLRYALDDVVYLGPLYLRLAGKLSELGREHWLDEDFAQLADPATYLTDPARAWQGVKGRQHLKGGQYAVLQALAAWREMEAVRADRPKRWILKDEVMIDLARRQPTHKGQLEQIRGLEPGFIKKRGDQLLQRIEQGRQLPREQWPREKAPPPRLTPNQEALTDLLQCSLRLLAREGRITHTALASRRDLERLAAGERDLSLLRGWRRALAGERLLEVLEGTLQPVVCGDGLRLRQPPPC